MQIETKRRHHHRINSQI